VAETLLVAKIVARIQALLPRDWKGNAGARFRKTLHAISDYATDHRVLPQDLLDDALDLGRRKVTGLASSEHSVSEKNYAEAAKAFSEVEDRKIDTELKRRSLESRAKKEEAEARKSLADARLTEIQAYSAELELLKKLQDLGVALRSDENGNLTVLPLPARLSLIAAPNAASPSIGSDPPPGPPQS